MIKYIYLDTLNEKHITKKRTELNALIFSLNFILKEGTTVTIVECSKEKPDLKIRINDDPDIIGVEHTRCYPTGNDELSESKSAYRKTCKLTIDQYRKDNTLVDKEGKLANHFTVSIFHDKLYKRLSKNDKVQIRDEIVMLINSKVGKGKRSATNIISDVAFRHDNLINDSETQIDVESNMLYLVPRIQDMSIDPIMKLISTKEKLLNEYKQRPSNTNVVKWWLMLHIPKSSYINPSNYTLPIDFSTDYDKIYIV